MLAVSDGDSDGEDALSFDGAAVFASQLRLRPGYELTIETDGMVLVSMEAENAYRPSDARRWYWSFRLTPSDLRGESSLLRRLVLGLVELDFHEHLEFLRIGTRHPVEPHRDPNGVEITTWPMEMRS